MATAASFLRLRNRYWILRHGKSIPNEKGIIVSSMVLIASLSFSSLQVTFTSDLDSIVLLFGSHCRIYPFWVFINYSLTDHKSLISHCSIYLGFFSLFLIGLCDELPFAAKQENGTLPQYELAQEGIKQAHLAGDKFKKVPTPPPLPPAPNLPPVILQVFTGCL